MTPNDYRTQTVCDLSEVAPDEWDALVPMAAPGAVFVRHAWLSALETSGSVGAATGWEPEHLLLRGADDRLVGAVPLYRKTHSYGEYVFDWAWADAYHRHGLAYYPKLVNAVPFTPVQGPRILGVDAATRTHAARALSAHAGAADVSSIHVLFPDPPSDLALVPLRWMRRQGVQFQWSNDGYECFDDFLASLSQPKRKKIRAERRKVSAEGIRCTRLCGDEIKDAHWRFFHACYVSTYSAHYSTPYLNLAFFRTLGARMRENCVMVVAELEGRPSAASLLIRDESRLYGRYWGALATVPFQHFEVAYYQAIEAAIALGITTIEGGAQGEHKMARGFLPVATGSWHWLAEPAFADAVDRFLAREGQLISGYLSELDERNPFRTQA